jgi:aspartate/methionine/tyrosine aminotransferase
LPPGEPAVKLALDMTSRSVSARVDALPRSGIRGVMELALQLPDVVRLEIGDPDFPTPEHIVEAAAQAARDGFTHYSPGVGLPGLRELIAEKVRAQNQFACTPEQVVVTTGACGGLFSTCLALLDPGDEVLVPDPGWTTLVPMAMAAGAVPVAYPLDRARSFALDVDAVASRISARTRAIVVNSPGNPTGAVTDRATFAGLLALVERHDLWLVSDECYEDIVFEDEHVSPASLDGSGRVVSVFSFSKSYAMTGWRVGSVVARPDVARGLVKAQEPVVSSASTISQKAAEAALLGPRDPVVAMRDEYRRRRDLALARLDAAGVRYARAGGAFYVMVDVSTAGEASEPFALRLLRDRRVAVVPGSAFGANGEGMVRVSLAAAPETIELGLERLATTLRSRSTASEAAARG